MTCRANAVEMSLSHCGIFACLSDAWLCIVVQKGQRAPQQLFFYNNKSQVSDLTTNRAVGSSNLSGRATNQKMGSHRAPFLIESAPDEGEDSCSTKRVSVLDAEGGPQARESPQGDSSQSLRARQILKVSRSSLLAPCYLPTPLSVLWRFSIRFGV